MFTVVSMVREDSKVLRKFVDYYLSEGADRIILYYDGVCPIAENAWPYDSVKIYNIDESFKAQNASGDPKDLIATQEMIFTCAHAANSSEWLLVVDADEFVYVPDTSIAEALGNVDDFIESIRFRVGEAVWGPADQLGFAFGCTYFRLPMGRPGSVFLPRILYGNISSLFRRGLLGHLAGKHAIRKGVEVQVVGCHFSRRLGEPIGDWSDDRHVGITGSFVAHFDSISFERWEEKWVRRFSDEVRVFGMGSGRSAQAFEAHRAVELGRAQPHFKRLYSLSKWQVAVLAVFRLLRRAEIFTQSRADQ